MAYWINHNNSYLPAKQIAFECDDVADVSNLPTSKKKGVQQGDDTTSCQMVNPGSSCLCYEDGNLYKLKSDDTWKVI